MVRTTVAVTMLSGGTAANVLPSQASATLNIRVAVGETAASVVARVTGFVDDSVVTVTVVEASDPSPEAPIDNEQFALLGAAVRASYPDVAVVPYVQMSATDGRHFHRFTPATYRFAPLAMSKAKRDSIHGVDEHVAIESLVRGEAFHRALIMSLPD
jgi:carboxypeptidase PM20D1